MVTDVNVSYSDDGISPNQVKDDAMINQSDSAEQRRQCFYATH